MNSETILMRSFDLVQPSLLSIVFLIPMLFIALDIELTSRGWHDQSRWRGQESGARI